MMKEQVVVVVVGVDAPAHQSLCRLYQERNRLPRLFYTDFVDLYQVTLDKRFYVERVLIPCMI